MTRSAKQVKKPGRAPAPGASRWLWVLGGLAVVWMIGAATLLDVRLGLNRGSERGYITVVQRRSSAGASHEFSGESWEVEMAATPGGRPFARFGLFLERLPLILHRRLEAEGVTPVGGVQEVGLAGDQVTRWHDPRHPYRVEFAGLSGRVVTRVVPTDRP